MNTIILEACESLEKIIESTATHDEVIERCAKEKLLAVYKAENDEFDRLLDTLEREVDFNDINGVKRCVTKIFKILASNRRNLKFNLERLM